MKGEVNLCVLKLMTDYQHKLRKRGGGQEYLFFLKVNLIFRLKYVNVYFPSMAIADRR